jgi:hypothetical protein
MTGTIEAPPQQRVALPRDCSFHQTDWDVLSRSWFPVARADEVKDRPAKAPARRRSCGLSDRPGRPGGARSLLSPRHRAELGLDRGRRHRVPLSRPEWRIAHSVQALRLRGWAGRNAHRNILPWPQGISGGQSISIQKQSPGLVRNRGSWTDLGGERLRTVRPAVNAGRAAAVPRNKKSLQQRMPEPEG